VTDQQSTRPTWTRHLDPFVLVIVLVALASRIALCVLGVGLDLSALGPDPADHSWQLLDPTWLRHDLLGSVASLTMQPPLYNLGVGLLLALPHGALAPVTAVALWAGFVVVALSAYGSMVLLGVSRRASLVVTLAFVVLDPAQLLFSAHLFYATPTAALMGATTFLGIWTLARPSWRRALAFSGSGAALALSNTLLQPLVLLIVIVGLALVLPSCRRALLVGSIVPGLCLAGWMGLSLARVGTPATSTWFGMNVAHGVLRPADPALVASMVSSGELSRLALVKPFSSLKDSGVAPVHAGPRASSAARRPDGLPNLNNRAFAEVSSRYLADSVAFIEHQPSAYLSTVWQGLKLWAVPSDQYYFFYRQHHTSGYEDAYDTVALLQASHDQRLPKALFERKGVRLAQVSWVLVLETLLGVVGGAVLIVGSLAARRRWALALGIPWFLATQAFVVSTFTEYGENNRFRFEAGIPLLVVATVVVASVLDRLRRHDGLSGRRDALGWTAAPEDVDELRR
jgi:hypothetical protein